MPAAAREQLGHRSPPRLIVVTDVGKLLAGTVPHDEPRRQLFDGSRRREARSTSIGIAAAANRSFNGRAAASITLSTNFKCSAVDVRLCRGISSTTRAEVEAIKKAALELKAKAEADGAAAKWIKDDLMSRFKGR